MSYSYNLPNLSFYCPHCGVFCKHTPLPIISEIRRNERVKDLVDYLNDRKEVGFSDFVNLLPGTQLCVTICPKCDDYCLLSNGELVWPQPVGIPASTHMPDLVRPPFEEAQKILHDSPWAACILLRIALERLCEYLGGTGDNLFKRIESLNLDASEKVIWKAIRKAGNAAAHENADLLLEYRSEMSPNIANTLSKFINQIIESHVANPAEAESIVRMLEDS